MKDYTKTYLNFFGLKMSDFITCEVCGAEAVDINHIWARSIRKDLENEISNLMAVCRSCHNKFGDRKQHRDFLIETHKKFMATNGKTA